MFDRKFFFNVFRMILFMLIMTIIAHIVFSLMFGVMYDLSYMVAFMAVNLIMGSGVYVFFDRKTVISDLEKAVRIKR